MKLNSILQIFKIFLFFTTLFIFIWENRWAIKNENKFNEGLGYLRIIPSLLLLLGLLTSSMPLLVSILFLIFEIIRILILKRLFITKKSQRALKHVFFYQYILPVLEALISISFSCILLLNNGYGLFISLEISIVICIMSLLSTLCFTIVWILKCIIYLIKKKIDKGNKYEKLRKVYSSLSPCPIIFMILVYLSIIML